MVERKKAGAQRSRNKILADINELVASPGYIFVIAELSSEDFFVDVRNVANIEWRGRLHNNEIGLLIGLLLKPKTINFEEIDTDKMQSAMQLTRDLLDELHWTFGYDFGKAVNLKVSDESDVEKERHIREIFGRRDAIVESTFYGDAGFYDMQCFELAAKLYANDMDWLKENTVFNLENAETVFLGIDDAINSLHYARSHEDILIEKIGKERIELEGSLRAIDEMAFPLSLIVISAKKRDKNITEKEVKDILDLFSCVPGEQHASFNEPGDENIFTYKPVIKLSDDVYFLPNKMFLASAVYKSPLYWMRQDPKYVSKANTHIGNITEDITYEYFVNIFGKQNVYKNIDVYKGKNRVTDIDVMGVLGNTVVIAQNKSKKMTIAALSGEVEAIKNDFQKAVIDPYEQGIKVRDIILGDQPYKLLDKSGKRITLPQGIEQAYILCVSNEPYPAVMTQMKAFLENVDQLPPMQISLFDLDLMSEYLTDPYELTFYIKQRVELDEKIVAGNEIILLAFHIKYGLFIPSGATMFSPDQSFGQLIDADYYHRKKGTPTPKKKDSLARDWHNVEYEDLLKLVKQIDDPKRTDIVFFLMSVPHDVIDVVTQYINNSKQAAAKDDAYHDFTIPITFNDQPWGGITYIIGKSFQGTLSRLETISAMNKYRSKADRWLALGARNDGILGMVAFDNAPWKQTQEMDDALDYYTQHTHGKQVEIDYKK
jgi:hypothetical protein